MRFAASADGIGRHRDIVSEELAVLDAMMELAEQCEAADPDGDDGRRASGALQRLRPIRESMTLRSSFLANAADEVRRMAELDSESGRSVLELLGIVR